MTAINCITFAFTFGSLIRQSPEIHSNNDHTTIRKAMDDHLLHSNFHFTLSTCHFNFDNFEMSEISHKIHLKKWTPKPSAANVQ